MRWARHVARLRILEVGTRFLLEKVKGRNHSGQIDIGGRIILKYILRK